MEVKKLRQRLSDSCNGFGRSGMNIILIVRNHLLLIHVNGEKEIGGLHSTGVEIIVAASSKNRQLSAAARPSGSTAETLRPMVPSSEMRPFGLGLLESDIRDSSAQRSRVPIPGAQGGPAGRCALTLDNVRRLWTNRPLLLDDRAQRVPIPKVVTNAVHITLRKTQ